MAAILQKNHHTTKFELLTPLRLGSLLFLVSMEMENWHQPLCKKESNRKFPKNDVVNLVHMLARDMLLRHVAKRRC